MERVEAIVSNATIVGLTIIRRTIDEAHVDWPEIRGSLGSSASHAFTVPSVASPAACDEMKRVRFTLFHLINMYVET